MSCAMRLNATNTSTSETVARRIFIWVCRTFEISHGRLRPLAVAPGWANAEVEEPRDKRRLEHANNVTLPGNVDRSSVKVTTDVATRGAGHLANAESNLAT